MVSSRPCRGCSSCCKSSREGPLYLSPIPRACAPPTTPASWATLTRSARLGYAPRYSLTDTVSATLAYWRAATTSGSCVERASPIMGTLNRIAPVFGVRDLSASLAHYRRLGFATTEYAGGGYGYAKRDAIEIHLGLLAEGDARLIRGTAYVWVDDADVLAEEWRSVGADVRGPEDTAWGQHEGVVINPDGNILRFGSPIKAGLSGAGERPV